MFDIQYLMSEWHDKSTILSLGLKHVLKQGMKILGVLVSWKWDRLVTYRLALVALETAMYSISDQSLFTVVHVAGNIMC